MRRTKLPITEPCELCGYETQLAWHHVFGGANRKHSDRWGMIAKICPTCHDAVHKNIKMPFSDEKISDILKKTYQEKFEQEHSREEFMRIFGRSWL